MDAFSNVPNYQVWHVCNFHDITIHHNTCFVSDVLLHQDRSSLDISLLIHEIDIANIRSVRQKEYKLGHFYAILIMLTHIFVFIYAL
jgi:hypothetical protein